MTTETRADDIAAIRKRFLASFPGQDDQHPLYLRYLDELKNGRLKSAIIADIDASERARNISANDKDEGWRKEIATL